MFVRYCSKLYCIKFVGNGQNKHCCFSCLHKHIFSFTVQQRLIYSAVIRYIAAENCLYFSVIYIRRYNAYRKVTLCKRICKIDRCCCLSTAVSTPNRYDFCIHYTTPRFSNIKCTFPEYSALTSLSACSSFAISVTLAAIELSLSSLP